jgi:Tol biopolymer transport system component
MNPNDSDEKLVFDVFSTGQANASLVVQGLAGAFQPDWSRDGEWLAFGLGSWFQDRALYTAWIYRVTANGSYYEQLTDGSINSGFPSYSHDGKSIVYRVYGDEFGLRVLNLSDKSIRVLTNSSDNLPHFSPDGKSILFTRKMNATNFDVCTISPDGTNLKVLTSSGANDAHAVWTADGRIMYSSGMYGFRVEAATYDDTFQPYGQIMIMNADGSDKRMLTDSMWEDSMPLYLPNEVLYSLYK